MKGNGIVIRMRHIFIFIFCFIFVMQICKIFYITYLYKPLERETHEFPVKREQNLPQKKIYVENKITSSCVRCKDIEELIQFFEQPDKYLVNVLDQTSQPCQKTIQLIDRIFQVDLSKSSEPINIPKEMETLVKEK